MIFFDAGPVCLFDRLKVQIPKNPGDMEETEYLRKMEQNDHFCVYINIKILFISKLS